MTTIHTVACITYLQTATGNLYVFLVILLWYNFKRTQFQQLPMTELQKIRDKFSFSSIKMFLKFVIFWVTLTLGRI